MSDNELDEEYNDLLNKSKEQPGVKDLMELYGQYDKVIQRSRIYLQGNMRKVISSSNNESTY